MPLLNSANAQEARRVLDLCNACRYCEGFCATFQALSQRREVLWQELDYFSNLCHNCTACYHACQYAPPHEFSINVPLALGRVRADSYQRYAWPGFLAPLFQRNGLILSLVTAVVLSLILVIGSLFLNHQVLFAQLSQPGAFYTIVSHRLMVTVAGLVFLYGLVSMTISVRRFCLDCGTAGGKGSWRGLKQALQSAATLRYLGGGHGQGCNTENEGYSNQRRVYHQLTMWGFLLCFAATCAATLYELGLGRISPFPYFSLPVILGASGGVAILVGTAGLTWTKLRTDTRPADVSSYGMDFGFLALLFFVSLTGLVLLGLRETSAMGVLLLVHLGFVLSLFLVLPYSKFVHAIYRFAALVCFHEEELQQNRQSHQSDT
ncbi:MAG: tricarballylate utilization 4Fe-4S protein TcuB [Pseudomonadales bacterium]|nr:tricarballylate utilization 4Fe-4S protein TcuB [Pseudomonadales bacterium]